MMLKRILASAIDFATLSLYGLMLYLVFSGFSISLNVWEAQTLGFCTLTVPVFSYFYISERSAYRATLGKRLMGLQVVSETSDKPRVLLRNVLKFLPWELAHTGVYQAIYGANEGQDPGWGTWFLLIAPQVIVLGYFMGLWYYKGERSFYDVFAKTRVRELKA